MLTVKEKAWQHYLINSRPLRRRLHRCHEEEPHGKHTARHPTWRQHSCAPPGPRHEQEELARACYVSRPSISNWECGKTQPSAEDLALLAAAFDITADELLRDVAPASHRTSADRRELTVLFWVWLALLLVTLFAVPGGGRPSETIS